MRLNFDPHPRSLVNFHMFMMCVWAVAVIPTVFWWKQSILWVAFMSLYANFVGHFGAMDAARAELKASERAEKEDSASG